MKGKRLTDEEFIIGANNKHNYQYNYDEIIYINNHTKINIFCKKCNEYFQQTPKNHLRGQGCPTCNGNINLTNDQYISRAIEKHGINYDYNDTHYISAKHKITIKCNTCNNIFEQKPFNHLNGQGCNKCNGGILLTHQEFLLNSIKIHQTDFDYSNVIYLGAFKKVEILCKRCNRLFKQRPNNHLDGQGCLFCKISKGEKIIEHFLKNNNIEYINQYKFKDCVYIKQLIFDFYLPKYNICIEFDGEQHFKLNSLYSNSIKLRKQQERDNIKNEYCLNNNIKLYRIKYNDNIYDELTKILHQIIL